jgi:hypothetical protein
MLDLRGLLGRLVLRRGEARSLCDHALGDRILGDLVPALEHGLAPRVAREVVRERDLLGFGVGRESRRLHDSAEGEGSGDGARRELDLFHGVCLLHFFF